MAIPQTLLVAALLAAVLYLIYRVDRLEKLVASGAKPRRAVGRPSPDGKVIPILRPDVEPGPFARGNAPTKDPQDD